MLLPGEESPSLFCFYSNGPGGEIRLGGSEDHWEVWVLLGGGWGSCGGRPEADPPTSDRYLRRRDPCFWAEVGQGSRGPRTIHVVAGAKTRGCPAVGNRPPELAKGCAKIAAQEPSKRSQLNRRQNPENLRRLPTCGRPAARGNFRRRTIHVVAAASMRFRLLDPAPRDSGGRDTCVGTF